MKKPISLLLAAVMLGCTVSCTLPADDSSATSSVDTSKHTQYLSDYSSKYYGLDTEISGSRITCGDNEVQLVTDGAAYGIETSDIPSDAYAIRSIAWETVIIASADDGLDRGVRRYAHDYMSSDGFSDESFSITEGIGYRVGAILIAGNDISEYKIYTEADGNESKAYAATELRDYIAKTVGAVLEITNTKPSGKYIELCFDRSTDDALGNEGYRISVTDAVLTIEGGERNGCLNGVYTFVEKYLGWRFLSDTHEYLYEADAIELENGLDFTDLPAFDYRRINAGTYNVDYTAKMKATQGGAKYGGAHVSNANHGLYSLMAKAGYSTAGPNPCFTDEYFYDDILAVIIEEIESKISSGLEYGIGKDFCMVDVAQLDIGKFCECKNCLNFMKEHGRAVSSTVLNFANKVAKVMQEEYPGIYVCTLAYFGTEVPPKNMTALDNVVVSYCFYVPCNNHCINGEDCWGEGFNNIEMDEEFRAWNEIASRVDAWYYPWQNFGAFTTFNVYDDLKYLYEVGGIGPFALMPMKNDQTFADLICYMTGRMAWSADTMTEEEFHGLIKEFLTLSYGEGGGDLYDLAVIWDDAGNRLPCWVGGTHLGTEVVEHEYFAKNYDLMCDLLKNAVKYAPSAEVEDYLNVLSCTIHYLGISTSYEDRYVNGTDAERAVIAERYRFMYDTWKKYGINPTVESMWLNVPDELDIEVNPNDWGWYNGGYPS